MKICLTLLAVLISVETFAEKSNKIRFTTVSRNREVFSNSDCEKTNSCDLKWFAINTDKIRADFDDGEPVFMTDTHVAYKTNKVEDLEKYGVVQFIRGCKFHSSVKDGKVEKAFTIVRKHYGQMKIFRHPNWVHDNFTRDPINWDEVEHAGMRHFAYQWNSVEGSTNEKTRKWYGIAKPTNPILYVSDIPGATGSSRLFATNSSLKFRTCIYKTSDVPTDVAEDNLDFAKPLKCFEWADSYIYNHQKGEYESPDEIDPVCLDAKP